MFLGLGGGTGTGPSGICTLSWGGDWGMRGRGNMEAKATDPERLSDTTVWMGRHVGQPSGPGRRVTSATKLPA